MFVYNFVDIIKLAQQKLFKLYYDPFIKYDNPTFDDFKFFFILSNDTFFMNWLFDLNGGEEKMYFAFYLSEANFLFIKPTTMVLLVFLLIIKDVFNKVITQFVVKLSLHFLEHEVMTTLSVVYPQL